MVLAFWENSKLLHRSKSNLADDLEVRSLQPGYSASFEFNRFNPHIMSFINTCNPRSSLLSRDFAFMSLLFFVGIGFVFSYLDAAGDGCKMIWKACWSAISDRRSNQCRRWFACSAGHHNVWHLWRAGKSLRKLRSGLHSWKTVRRSHDIHCTLAALASGRLGQIGRLTLWDLLFSRHAAKEKGK